MKTNFIPRVSRYMGALLAICGATLSAQTESSSAAGPINLVPPTEIDKTWSSLEAESARINQSRRINLQGRGSAVGREGNPDRSSLQGLANKARNFYANNPAHAKSADARQLEVFTLIQLEEEGDSTVEDRLEQAVNAAVADQSVPEKVRAKIAAARAFTKETRKAENRQAHFAAVDRVSRQLMKDYPTQPQAYEALLAVARVSDDRKRLAYANEIVASAAPARLKHTAQLILDRQALEGRALEGVIGKSAKTLLSELPPETPLIVYSWATWGPGSLELGRMIQARRFNAIGVCMDTDLEKARQAQHDANLGGEHVYDDKGTQGELASRLKFSTAGQIYLVDKKGVIRDVRGGDDLENKLRNLEFKTPVLKEPTLSL